MRMLLILCEIAAIWAAAAVLLRPVFAAAIRPAIRQVPRRIPSPLDHAA